MFFQFSNTPKIPFKFAAMFRALLGLLILLSLSSPCRSESPVLLKSDQSRSLFGKYEQLTVTDEAMTFSRKIALQTGDKDIILAAVPPGELKLDILDIELREFKSGLPLDDPDPVLKGNLLQQLRERCLLEEYGSFRGLRTALIHIKLKRPLSDNNISYEVAGYTARISWPIYNQAKATPHDTAFEPGSPYRTVLETLLVCPEAIDLFRQPLETPSFPGPTKWQPSDENSPGFPWLKIPVKEDNLYTIDGRWLSEAGIDPSSLSPSDLYIMCQGVQVPVAIRGPKGKGFSGGERLAFYALGNDSNETAEQVYFLGKRPEGVGQRIFQTGPRDSEQYPQLTKFSYPATIKEENHFETEFGSFLSVQKISWYWGEIPSDDVMETKFDLPGLSNTDKDKTTTISLILHFKGKNRTVNSKLDVYQDDQVIATLPLKKSQSTYDVAVTNNTLSQRTNKLGLKIVPPKGKTNTLPIFLDSINVSYDRFFKSEKGSLEIKFAKDEFAPYGKYRIRSTGFRASSTLALDISDPLNPTELSTSSKQRLLWIRADLTPDSHLLITEERNFSKAPEPVSSSWNKSLLENGSSADILILYHPLFTDAAKELESYYQQDNIIPYLVNIDSVYESFNHGNLSTDAIRNFLAYTLFNWKGERTPQAALLIGDSNSDGRGEARNGVPNYMPIHLYRHKNGKNFSCDSYYSWLDNNDEATDLLIGRVSSELPEDALAWVSNLKKYRQYSKNKDHPWKNQIMAIADTGNFYPELQEVLDKTISRNPQVEILAADNFLWEDNFYLPPHLINRVEDSKVCPLLTTAIEDGYNAGSAMSVFIGHGAPNLWSNQRYWFGGGTPNSDILRLKNGKALPFVTSFTCNNAVVDYPIKPWNICLAEDFMRHPDKGAISCFMPTGPGYLPQHKIMIEGLLKSYEDFNIRTMSSLSELARLYQKAHAPQDNHSRMFLYLGDPFLSLPTFDHVPAKQPLVSKEKTLIKVVNKLTGETITPGSKWAVFFENPEASSQRETLVATLYDRQGKIREKQQLTFTVDAHQNHVERLDFDLQETGQYMLDFSLVSESAQRNHSKLPSRHFQTFFQTGEGDELVILEPSIKLSSRAGNKGKISIEGEIINTSQISKRGKMSITLSDGTELSSRDLLLNPQANQTAYIDLEKSAELLENFAATINVYSQKEKEGPFELVQKIPFKTSSSNQSDLTFVNNSVEVSPESPSDGLTILVDAIVVNKGKQVSSPTSIALFKEDDHTFKSPLRNIPGKNLVEIPPLNPDEQYPVQLRWDPSQNAGSYQVQLRIDPKDLCIESNKKNNTLLTPLNVRSKMKLVTNGITVEESKVPGTVNLVASVKNEGETDAPRVAVYFYRTKEQTKDNMIGEVLIDQIPAMGEQKAVFTWSLIEEKDNLEILDPSFTVALKGSLMRTSSVSDQ